MRERGKRNLKKGYKKFGYWDLTFYLCSPKGIKKERHQRVFSDRLRFG
jgi:hypothetical protein